MKKNVDEIQTETARYQAHLAEEQKRYGHCREIVRNGTRFLLHSNLSTLLATTRNSGVGLQQQIGDKNFDYYKLVDFVITKPQSTLDLTWMQPEDVLAFGSIPQYRALQTLVVNIDNLVASYLPSAKLRTNLLNKNLKDFQKKDYIIHGENSQLNFIQQVKTFNSLLAFNCNDINSITLQGFNAVTEKILIASAKMKGVAVNTKNNLAITEPELTR